MALTSTPELRGGIRRGLGRLGSGLIVGGILGIAVAATGFGALVWVDGRVNALRTEVDDTLTGQAAALELAAGLLHDASTTVGGFGVTVDQSAQAVSAAAVTIGQVHTDLPGVEAQLRSVNILGATPLSSAADTVGRITTSVEGLDIRLSLVANGLEGNRQALASNAETIGRLGDVTAALASQMRSGAIEDSLGELQLLISVTLLVFSAWSLVPAVGALLLGVWLRRELARSLWS